MGIEGIGARVVRKEDKRFITGAGRYVDDMVEGVLRAMEHPKASGESFNIGNQRAVVTIYGLANAVVRVLDSKSTISFSHKDYVDVELRIPSVGKARDLLGFEAKVDLDEGILRTAEYYRRHLPRRAN